MSTRARIGVVRPDGSVLSIYTHCDGYISPTARQAAVTAARRILGLIPGG